VPLHRGDAEEGRPERPDLAVREVDDPVGAVDEHQADGQQPVGETDDGAEQDHRQWRRRLDDPVLVEHRAHELRGHDACGEDGEPQSGPSQGLRVGEAHCPHNGGHHGAPVEL
jgi:hypothetical protein